jgi:uncharacterized protein YbaP (TraB family)
MFFRNATKGGDALAHGAERVKDGTGLFAAAQLGENMMGLKWLSRGAAAFATLALALAPPLQAKENAKGVGGHPAMWKLSDRDTTIYLFGTFHLLPQGQAWRTPAFDKALNSAGELVLEVPNIDDANAVAAASMKMGLSPGLPPLVERVPAEKRATLEAMIAELGAPAGALDQFETWLAALALVSVTFKRLGLAPNSGVELSITAPFRASGKPIKGLETLEQQFGFFDRLSEESQRKFLVGVLDSPEQTKKEFAAMIAAWSSGDLAGIARWFDDEAQMTAELHDVLMARRNARWAEWLKARMDQPGTVFVAVGAGHLAGKDSVENLLAAKGLKVKRVQ